MKRRSALALGAGAAALGAGAWVSLSRHGVVEDDGSEMFWQQQFDTPGGDRLAMSSLRGRALVVNFWATWCAPCIREMPQLDQFHRHQGPDGWQVVGVAIDRAEPVKIFLGKTPVSFTIALAGMDGLGSVRALGNAQGALPYTVLLGRNGRVAWRKLGETTHDELLRETSQIA